MPEVDRYEKLRRKLNFESDLQASTSAVIFGALAGLRLHEGQRYFLFFLVAAVILGVAMVAIKWTVMLLDERRPHSRRDAMSLAATYTALFTIGFVFGYLVSLIW